ncbi:AlpA family transcriptional regulator [Herbaspirillum sp. ST 5-3]|uniref:helix-turn-helix transcriptional regulator n=1 Tax=Oxalobacteraceae TaxID=75682 RepID=UPI0010A33C0C|nr:AlpA family transcriptional regulator [Herbaspirillum sp. ST 5-3]
MNDDAVLQFPTTSCTVLRLPRVKDRTGLSRSGIYDGVKKGTFPAPIKLGERAVGWLSIDIDRWLEDRVVASRREAA